MPSRILAPAAVQAVIRLALAAVLVLALAACDLVGVVGVRSWGVAEDGPGGSRTVKVTDASGRVNAVEFDPADADLFTPVSVPAGVPNALDVTWTGGACDKATDVAITAAGAGLAVDVSITLDDQRACDAFGEPRVIRLLLNAPIAPAAVTVTQGSAIP